VIFVDTILLVYARCAELPQHEAALERLRQLAQGDEP
jgi:predicted nucleic acid-binding protein